MRQFRAVALLALLAGAAEAPPGEPLSAECRRQVVTLCGTGNFRECLATKMRPLDTGCRAEIMARARARGVAQASAEGAREITYGSNPLQRLDLSVPRNGEGGVPLVVFIHGGGWSIGDKGVGAGTKAKHFNGLGYGFASLNYRLVPQATVEQQAADIAAALAELRKRAGELDIDGSRIVLMGHSAGAHLAALVAADPRYLKAAGVPMNAVRGVVLLDGAGYDVAKQMADPRNLVRSMYAAAFGSDPERQYRLSPIAHAAAPNVAKWLILPVASRADSPAQSRALADALCRNGTDAVVTPVPDSNHMKLNRDLGTVGDLATSEVDRFVVAAIKG